jgi:hypothetical protein
LLKSNIVIFDATVHTISGIDPKKQFPAAINTLNRLDEKTISTREPVNKLLAIFKVLSIWEDMDEKMLPVNRLFDRLSWDKDDIDPMPKDSAPDRCHSVVKSTETSSFQYFLG